MRFSSILTEVYNEIKDVEKLKQPIIDYVYANADKVVTNENNNGLLQENAFNVSDARRGDEIFESVELNFEEVLKIPEDFIEAIRQMQTKLGGGNLTLTHRRG